MHLFDICIGLFIIIIITIIIIIIIIIIAIQPLGRSDREQSSVRRLVWLWYAASWASS